VSDLLRRTKIWAAFAAACPGRWDSEWRAQVVGSRPPWRSSGAPGLQVDEILLP